MQVEQNGSIKMVRSITLAHALDPVGRLHSARRLVDVIYGGNAVPSHAVAFPSIYMKLWLPAKVCS